MWNIQLYYFLEWKVLMLELSPFLLLVTVLFFTKFLICIDYFLARYFYFLIIAYRVIQFSVEVSVWQLLPHHWKNTGFFDQDQVPILNKWAITSMHYLSMTLFRRIELFMSKNLMLFIFILTINFFTILDLEQTSVFRS